MKVLYLYMFPMWGNGSGSWLTRLVNQLEQKYQDDFTGAILAPDTRHLRKIARMFRLVPPQMGVFVANPEIPGGKKYSQMSTKEHMEIYTYYLSRTAKVIEKFKPDIIHVFHTAFLPPIARQLLDFYKIPYIISTHGSDLYYFKEDPRWVSQVRDASVQSKFITANSNFTRDWYVKMFGKNISKKMRVIPAGVDNNINFEKDISWIDKKLNFKHKHMVLFTGRLTEHKGVDYLIKAAQGIKAEIVVIGDGPERPYLESLIKKYKLDNVHMLGYMSHKKGELNDFYLRADVYVAPSTWSEPLGLVILEAMVYKTPVVVTRKGGVTTLVQDGSNGFLVRPRSSKMIADKVNLLLKDDKLRKKMADTAYKSVKTKFSWDKIATKFYHLYEKAQQPAKKQVIIKATKNKNKGGKEIDIKPISLSSIPITEQTPLSPMTFPVSKTIN